MDEFLSMDLALAMISANEAITFFDTFYDKRNGYAAAYEAVKFDSSDTTGNRSRSGTIFGKETSASINAESSTFDKFKYHATSMLIHIYNAIEKIFSAILSVLKTIGRVIIAPFKFLYRKITGNEFGKTAHQEMEDVVAKYAKEINIHLPTVINTVDSLMTTADGTMTKMFPIIEKVSKASAPVVGKLAQVTYTKKSYIKDDIDGLKDLQKSLDESIADGKTRVESSTKVLSNIISKISDDISKIRKRRPDLKGDTRQWILCYIMRPSLLTRLEKVSMNVEKSASNAIQKTQKLASQAKKDNKVDSYIVQAAKVCNGLSSSCLNAVRIYRDTLILFKVAPDAESTADNLSRNKSSTDETTNSRSDEKGFENKKDPNQLGDNVRINKIGAKSSEDESDDE